MKKSTKKYFESLSYKTINDMTFEEAENKSKELLPPGTKFYSAAMGDKDPRYVVKYTKDETMQFKDYGTPSFVIVRSWNKFKQLWNYKILRIHDFIFCLHLDIR